MSEDSSKARVVTIDLDDDVQTRALASAVVKHLGLVDGRHFELHHTAVHKAVAEQLPKPEEPTGLGAVVVDANGQYWVCPLPGGGIWAPEGSVSIFESWIDYDEIAVVEVLNPGTQL